MKDTATKNVNRLESKVDVSVVIPTYNYAKDIGNCLIPLLNQTGNVSYELIMIDTSTDGTDLVVKEKFPQVKLFHFNGRKYVGEARNAGVDRATGKYILFIDQDCIAPENWVERMFQLFEKTNADGIGGSLENGTPSSYTGTAGYFLEFFRFIPTRNKGKIRNYKTNSYLVGANCGYKRDVFDTHRYYDNYEKTMIGEDFYFYWQLAQKRMNLVCDPSISVKHMNKTGLPIFFAYQKKIGKSACAYRNQVRDKSMNALSKMPFLCFTIPWIIIPRIAITIISRSGFHDILRFLATLPLLVIGNYTWAYAFFKELKKANTMALS